MFHKILIANRGEIACRVIRTARRMGVATVAVYSEADAGALHVAMADEARLIGPAPARDSYLDIDAVIAAARDTGAQAVHPGYGFLSENAEFAKACAAAGIVFIGPSPAAIRAMGSKSAAKALMAQHGVPVVPGYHGDDQSPERLLAEAERIGFPVLIKASAGGGGRGMRGVDNAGEFMRALDGAKREAKGAFGDDTVLIERYLARPRHIEVQVFGDTHGNIVHLHERDCSIQRRHQKVVEEAPAPGLDRKTRQALGETAVTAARAVDYVGAGTIEFIMEGEHFYFMEMNTRLQVEHPVTEAVTGTDLVEWQLRVAAGERFTRTQEQIPLRGHAIEVRLYAENPARGFLPSTGTLQALHLPDKAGIRVDTGVRQGDTVTPFYDPMIAKIIGIGRDRDEARIRLEQALADTAVQGVTTNLGFLVRTIATAEFAAGPVDTGFIGRHETTLLAPPPPPPDAVLAAAALQARGQVGGQAGGQTVAASDPWARGGGWRLNGTPAPQTVVLRSGEAEHRLDLVRQGVNWSVSIAGGRLLPASMTAQAGGRTAITLGGNRANLRVVANAASLTVFAGGESWQFETIDPLAPPAGAEHAAGSLTSPMPGKVIQLLVAPGDTVRQGQAMMVVEAMKMEHTITAPRDGVVMAVHFAAGDLVEEGAELIALEAGGN